MAITDRLVLPKDVFLQPVRDVEVEARAQLACKDDDYVVTRLRSRAYSILVDSRAANLVALFRSPQRIVEAVVHFSAVEGVDPEQTLQDAYPLLRRLYDSRLLVEDGSTHSTPIEPLLNTGDSIQGFRAMRCIQALEDTEVYQVRGEVGDFALKISRSSDQDQIAILENEERILECLDGDPSPRLIEAGTYHGRKFIVTEWCQGVSALMASRELRRQGQRMQLLELSCRVANSYSTLERKNVIHGDVHPRNILVLSDGSVRILDFGLAHLQSDSSETIIERGGVAHFFEPEYAKAVLAKKQRPGATIYGEQYGLAALIYLLLTGSHYLDFSVEQKSMMRQICEETPLPFAARRTEPWPEVETVLSKALRKSPGLRYSAMSEFADALRNILRSDVAPRPLPWGGASRSFVANTFQKVDPDSELFKTAKLRSPKCSINYGAAGTAYAWYRMALLQDQPSYLAHADLWINLAYWLASEEGAFYNPELGICEEEIGPISLFHTSTGIHCVQALVSHSRGDFDSANQAVQRFVSDTHISSDNLDLTLGQCSLILGCASMLEVLSTSPQCDLAPLITLGSRVAQTVQAYMDGCPPIVTNGNSPQRLGIAHGWAGFLYSLLRWHDAIGTSAPGFLGMRLNELAALVTDEGSQGASWSQQSGSAAPELASSWCTGSAGYVFLWLQAYRHFSNSTYLALAERAALASWESSERNVSLCCGLVGRAYSLAHLYRHSSATEWLRRARDLCDRATALGISDQVSYSLYKGNLGVALLAAELEQPEFARLPLFESENWRPE